MMLRLVVQHGCMGCVKSLEYIHRRIGYCGSSILFVDVGWLPPIMGIRCWNQKYRCILYIYIDWLAVLLTYHIDKSVLGYPTVHMRFEECSKPAILYPLVIADRCQKRWAELPVAMFLLFNVRSEGHRMRFYIYHVCSNLSWPDHT